MNDLPRLPDYVPPYMPPKGSLSRPSAQSIRETVATPRELSLTLAGYNEPIPLLYGEDRVAGKWLVRPYTSGGNMRFAMAWCWGEIEGVQSVYINGQLVNPAHMTHRTGTPGQGIDSMLSNDLSGFADRYANCAYTVFNIPAGTYEGFPQTHQIEAVVRGRLCYDPRASVTQWTENPALQMADWISAGGDISPGMTVYGLVEAANHCDEILGDIEIRCQTAITVVNGLTTPQMLDMFAAYAECLWSYRDDGVLIVPDGIVDSPVATLTESEMMNLRLLGAESLRSPTSVSITYRAPSGTGDQWSQETVTQMLPGVENGDIAEIPSDITLLGVHRSSEASRKALMRLRRLSRPGQYAWQAFDEGIRFERGDVVKLPNALGLSDTLCRILSLEMASPGIYQITAEHYSDDMYPDDVEPGESANILEHSIVPFSGSSVPTGWARYTAADGNFISGAGSSIAPGSTGGSYDFTVSGNTGMAGQHTGSGSFPVQSPAENLSTNPLVNGGNSQEPAHNHSYSRSLSRVPAYRQEILIQKTGGPGQLPAESMVLASGQIISPALTEMSEYIGRLMRAGDAETAGLSRTWALNLQQSDFSQEGNHTHGQTRVTGGYEPSFEPTYQYLPAGAHRHAANISLSLNPRRRRLAFYFASGSTQVVPGAIAFWPANQTLPSGTGWHYMDGNNGTLDMEGYLIERSSSSDAGQAVGNDTVSWTGQTTGHTHSHRGAVTGNRTSHSTLHSDNESHSHSANGSSPYRPPWYALRIIQYTGVA